MTTQTTGDSAHATGTTETTTRDVADLSDAELTEEFATRHYTNGYRAAWAEADERFAPADIDYTGDLSVELDRRLARAVEPETVTISRKDVELSLEIAYDYHNDQDYFENMPPNIRAYVDRLRAALGRGRGAGGGE